MSIKNKKKIKIIILVFFLTSLLYSNSKNYVPDNNKVDNSLEEIKKEIIKEYNTIEFIEYFIEKLFEDLKNVTTLLKILLILFCVTITILILYFLLKNIFRKKIVYKANIDKNKNEEIFNKKFLENLLKCGKYSESILYIYNSLIKIFKNKNYIYKYNATNKEIYNKLEKELAENFREIYKIAEKILFNNYFADNNEAIFCYNIFKKLRID